MKCSSDEQSSMQVVFPAINLSLEAFNFTDVYSGSYLT